MKSPGLVLWQRTKWFLASKISATKPQQLATPSANLCSSFARCNLPRGPSLGHSYGRAPNGEGPIISSQVVNPFGQPNPASIPFVGGGDFFIHGRTPSPPLQLPQTPGRRQSATAHTHTYTFIFYEIELNFPLDCGEK